jgi:hypothetical protein
VGEQQRVAVGRGTGRLGDADGAAGAGDVVSPIRWPRMRARASVGPPAANGTITVIGFVG